MADAVYKIKFTMSDGSVKEVQFTAPQGPQGPAGTTNPVYSKSFGGYLQYKFAKDFLNAIVSNNPSSRPFLKLTYCGVSATLTLSGSTSGSITINAGESIILEFHGETTAARPIVNGIVETTSSQSLAGSINWTGGNGINSFVEFNSEFDLSPYLG